MVRDITERKRIARELEASREQLRHFAASLDHAIEEERGRIARELHDELGQVFTALTMDLDLLDGMLTEHAPGDDFGAVGDKIEGMSQMINDSIGVVRRIASDLRPPMLDNLGLDAAIEAYAQQFSKRTGIPCALEVGPQTYPTGHIATAVFRICQEALTNIIRHADASNVWISLGYSHDGLHLNIQDDDGRGISDSQMANPLSVGLTSMRERARLLGGTLTISGLPDKGTSVSLWVSPPSPQ
jgi:signal transduction histidine kinase